MLQDRWRSRTDAGSQQVPASGRLSSNSGEITRTWALAGLGVVLKSLWDIDEDLKSEALVEVLADLVDEQSGICACHPSRDLLTERVRSLLDSLAMRLRPDPAG